MSELHDGDSDIASLSDATYTREALCDAGAASGTVSPVTQASPIPGLTTADHPPPMDDDSPAPPLQSSARRSPGLPPAQTLPPAGRGSPMVQRAVQSCVRAVSMSSDAPAPGSGEPLPASPAGSPASSPRGMPFRSVQFTAPSGATAASPQRRATAAPELLEFLEGAKRRASRVGLDGALQGSPTTRASVAATSAAAAAAAAAAEASAVSPLSSDGEGILSRRSSDGDGSDSEPGEADVLRSELDRCKFDILQMADLGSALVVDLEDTRHHWAEAEADRDGHELRAEVLQEKVHELTRRNNELKQLLEHAREQADDDSRRHATEMSELVRDLGGDGAQAKGAEALQAESSQFEQSVALHQLRRARLLAERVEAANALFKSSSTEPQVMEAQNRVSIEKQAFVEKAALVHSVYLGAMYGWADAMNELDLATIARQASRRQVQGLSDARMRAETMAAEQSALHHDACKMLTEREKEIVQLTGRLASQRVASVKGECLVPTVLQALRKVKGLHSACNETQNMLSPAPDATSFISPAGARSIQRSPSTSDIVKLSAQRKDGRSGLPRVPVLATN